MWLLSQFSQIIACIDDFEFGHVNDDDDVAENDLLGETMPYLVSFCIFCVENYFFNFIFFGILILKLDTRPNVL
jgi:hypothetical protein